MDCATTSTEDYRNHQNIWEYHTFEKYGVSYNAISTFDSIVKKMRPLEKENGSGSAYLVVYDMPPVWSDPQQAIQDLVNIQNKIIPLSKEKEYDTSLIACKIEKYDGKDICAPWLVQKSGYQFFHIAPDENQEKLQTEQWIIVSCGHMTFGPSQPNQYFIYSEKTGKILYVNTTQDPYPFDPTSIEF